MAVKSESKRQENFFDTCSQCQTNWSCCHATTPPVTGKRRKIIEDYLRETGIHIENPFVKTDYTFPRLNKNGYCVFHDKKTRKCLVHVVKPETCVAGPITFDIDQKTGNIEWFMKKEKICPLAKLVYGDRKSLRKHVECAKKEISRLVGDLDSEALCAILRKAEPETFKIDEEKIGKNVLRKLEQS